jgi:ribonuclease HI
VRRVWVDASCVETHLGRFNCGWAVVFDDKKCISGFVRDIKNTNIGELIAIVHALTITEKIEDKVVIFSDSVNAIQYVTGTASSKTFGHFEKRLIKRARILLKEARQRRVTQIKWIKGHSGNEFHNKADRVAARRVVDGRNMW